MDAFYITEYIDKNNIKCQNIKYFGEFWLTMSFYLKFSERIKLCYAKCQSPLEHTEISLKEKCKVYLSSVLVFAMQQMLDGSMAPFQRLGLFWRIVSIRPRSRWIVWKAAKSPEGFYGLIVLSLHVIMWLSIQRLWFFWFYLWS